MCKYVIPHYQVVIAVRSHLFPFRTEKLSSLAPMVLQCGRVGSRLLLSRASITKVVGAFLFSCGFCFLTLIAFLCWFFLSRRFGFPFGRRFSIHGFAQILSLQQRFSLSFAAIDISLHANYALILLNTNCTNYTNKVYHQYSIPTIFQVVTPISFLKNVIFVPHCSIALRLSSLEWGSLFFLMSHRFRWVHRFLRFIKRFQISSFPY